MSVGIWFNIILYEFCLFKHTTPRRHIGHMPRLPKLFLMRTNLVNVLKNCYEEIFLVQLSEIKTFQVCDDLKSETYHFRDGMLPIFW